MGRAFPAIQVRGVSKRYGRVAALKSVSLEVLEGEVFGLLGPNGAGKTTLMEIIVGLRKPDSGEVLVLGKKPSLRELGRLIGFVPQETMLYEDLTVYENLKFIAALYYLDKRDFEKRLEELASVLGFKDLVSRRFGKLSGGQRRRVALAASLLHDPPILVLDEPTLGLDPDARREFWALILSMKEEGKTMLLSTHYMEEADELCDRVAIINEGVIVEVGRPEDLKKMYGGSSKVVVKVKIRDENVALKTLSTLGARRTQEGILVETEEPEELVPVLVEKLNAVGVYPEAVQIRSPTLEDVFLNLTGRRLVEVVE